MLATSSTQEATTIGGYRGRRYSNEGGSSVVARLLNRSTHAKMSTSRKMHNNAEEPKPRTPVEAQG